ARDDLSDDEPSLERLLAGEFGTRAEVAPDRRVPAQDLDGRHVALPLDVRPESPLGLVDDLDLEPWATALVLGDDHLAPGLRGSESGSERRVGPEDARVTLGSPDEAHRLLVELEVDGASEHDDALVGRDDADDCRVGLVDDLDGSPETEAPTALVSELVPGAL